MKRYIKFYSENYNPEIPIISGKIEDTDERCKMQANGYWVGAGGKHITSYQRIDKDVEYDNAGNPVFRQYSMDRHHRFWVETEDRI